MTELTLTVVDRSGESHEVGVESGTILMHVLRDNVDYDIGICGGEISCGTCLVRLQAQWRQQLGAASEDEAEMLDALDAEEGARLGCQIVVDASAAGMQVTLMQED